MLNKLLIFLFVIISCIENVPAQVIGNFSYDYWYVAPETILHRVGRRFEKANLPFSTVSGFNVDREESLSNIYDIRFNTLYTLVNRTFYKNDTLIASDLNNSPTSSQGALIIPDIWDGNRLYVFCQNGFYSDLSYSIFDILSAKFIKKNIPIVKNASEQLHSIFVNNNFRLVTTDIEGNLITFSIDSAGISAPKNHYKVNSNKKSIGSLESIKFSNKGNLISALFIWQNPRSLYLYKYDILKDEACLISYNNRELTSDSYNLDFDISDGCIFVGSISSNINLFTFTITEDFNFLKINEVKQGNIKEFVTIPKEATFSFIRQLIGNEWKLIVIQLNECGLIERMDTLETLKNSFCLPNIPKVIDSIYAPPDYPCLNPEDIEYTYREYEDIFKNVLTPNNDGFNDFFTIVWPDFWKFSYYKVTILNRYGQTIYASNDLKFSWDGKRNGRKVPDGAYYYVIEFNEKILGQKVFTGAINVMD